MDEQVTAQAAAVLRFKQFIELHISERVIAKYDDGRPMGNDADIFLEYLQGVEQRLVAAEAALTEAHAYPCPPRRRKAFEDKETVG